VALSPRDLKELRRLASSRGEELNFCRLVEKVLLTSFDEAFVFLKTQKLMVKSRDCAVIRRMCDELTLWLRSAPLSGKRRATLKRHLEVCYRIQQLYSSIDEEALGLSIWGCSQTQLAIVLLESVEQCYELCTDEAAKRKWEGLNVWEALDSSRSLTATLRNYCDVTLTIIARVALQCPKDGKDFDDGADLRRAVALGSTYDDLSTMVDHYTYNRWRASITGSDIQFHPTFDDFDRARQWCAQRTEAANHRLRDAVTAEYLRIRGLAKQKVSAASIPARFDDFLQSEIGQTVRLHANELRKLMARFLAGKVSEVFELEAHMRTKAGVFQISDMVSGWSAIWVLAIYARIWNSVRVVDGEFRGGFCGRVPVMRFGTLDEFLRNEVSFTQAVAESFRMQFTADLDVPSSLDLFYRPLLRVSDDECALAISFAETSRFDRNLFRIALRDSDMDISKRGFKPLAKIEATFHKMGFQARSNVPLLSGGKVLTDADMLAYKDGLIFVGQVKIVIDADSVYETWQVEQKLRAAAEQLRRTIAIVENLGENLLTEVGLPSLNALPLRGIVPFLLTNDWHFTGSRIDGYSIIDISYLMLILEQAAVRFGTRDRPVELRFVKGDVPTADELKELIEHPIHRGMFRRPEVHFVTRSAGTLSFSVPATPVPGAE
jgi:hypothetical protein